MTDSADLVGRLRDPDLSAYQTLRNEAADEIESLRDRNLTLSQKVTGGFAFWRGIATNFNNRAKEDRALRIASESKLREIEAEKLQLQRKCDELLVEANHWQDRYKDMAAAAIGACTRAISSQASQGESK